jgi:hypothetical protein
MHSLSFVIETYNKHNIERFGYNILNTYYINRLFNMNHSNIHILT